MGQPDRSQARSWEGKDVVDHDGQRLGRCVGVFADTATGVPEWLHVDVEGSTRSFVPAIDAAEDDGTVRVRFSRDAVLGAPAVGDDEQLSKAEEVELYRHYGVPVEGGDGSVLPADSAEAPTSTPVAAADGSTGTSAAAGSGADPSAGDDAEQAPALDDDGTVSGGAVTPQTGEDLPVLDPSAASTAVPDGQQVPAADAPGRTDDAGDVGDAAVTAPAAPAASQQQAPPVLRPVPAASPPPARPSSGSDLSALTPLGAIAGLAAAVGLVLQARERRARRRRSAAARAGRLGDVLRASAGTTLAGVADAAEQTRRGAATAGSRAARAASRQQERAAAVSRRQRAQTASALAVAAKTAGAQKKAAARAAEQRRKAARASLAGAAQAAAQQRKAATSSLAAASTSSRRSSATGSVVAAPRKVAKGGRRVRRSLARKLWNAVVLGAAGGGYVLGAKAGRQRYDELAQVASAVAGSPKVQSATEAVKDPERRTDLLLEVQQQAGSLVGRRGEPRS